MLAVSVLFDTFSMRRAEGRLKKRVNDSDRRQLLSSGKNTILYWWGTSLVVLRTESESNGTL